MPTVPAGRTLQRFVTLPETLLGHLMVPWPPQGLPPSARLLGAARGQRRRPRGLTGLRTDDVRSAVAQIAEDEAAYAVAEREEYLDLISALGKLGARVRVPDALPQAA